MLPLHELPLTDGVEAPRPLNADTKEAQKINEDGKEVVGLAFGIFLGHLPGEDEGSEEVENRQ